MPQLVRQVPSLQWVRPPVQTRSQQTLQRLLDAAEAIIDEQGPEAAPVAEIARRAGSSVGAFYARFPDKEALLRSVFERFTSEATATVDQMMVPARWVGIAADQIVLGIVRFTTQVFRERAGLIAAFASRAPRDPELESLSDRLGELIATRLYALLADRAEPLAHPQPELAVRMIVWIVLGALEANSHRVHALVRTVPESQLAAEIAHMCNGYLGLTTTKE